MNFYYLNANTIYSFHDTALSIEDYISGLNAYEYSGGGICDFNHMRGFAEYEKAFKNNDKKFLMGLRINLTIDEYSFEALLYIKNYEGYKFILENIIGPKRSEININDLDGQDDLILIIRANSSLTSSFVFSEELEETGGKIFSKILSVTKKFYIGIEYYSEIEKEMIEALREFAKKHSLDLVAIPEIKYLNRKLAKRYDILQAIKKKELYAENSSQPIFYMLGPKALSKLYTEEEIENTIKIADMCSFSLFDKRETGVDFGKDKKKILEDLVFNKIKDLNLSEKYLARARKELSVIFEMNFADYFLLVQDYVNFAKTNDIKVGPGRGSSASSLVAYLLGITEIDPLKYDLIFERFLNKDRKTMPDIDIDFEDDKRELVIEYLKQKYGESHVKHIITYATYRASSAINAAGSVLNVAPERLKRITSELLPGASLEDSFTKVYELNNLIQDSYYRNIYDCARLIENFPYNCSIHASGIIVSGNNLEKELYYEDDVLGYEFPLLEKMGYLKLDILGLSNLSFIRHIEDNLRKIDVKPISYKDLDLEDKCTYEFLSKKATLGIFQLESFGMKNVIDQVQPQNFADLYALIALYRPGPKDNIQIFANNKHIERNKYSEDKDINDIISQTYGIIVYQEQVMQLASKFAGLNGSEADNLRRAISKKDSEYIAKYQEEFIARAQQNGKDLKVALDLYQWIEKFGGYGFNKAHTVSYAYITYLLLYYKAHYPEQFYQAMLDLSSLTSLLSAALKEEIDGLGLKLCGPNVFNIYKEVKIVDNKLYLPLSAIKGLSEEAVNILISLSLEPNLTLEELFMKTKINELSNKDLLKLIDSGFFDHLEKNREKLRENIVTLLNLKYCEEGNYITLSECSQNVVKDYCLEKEVFGSSLSTSLLSLTANKWQRGEEVYVIISCTSFSKTEYEAINDYGTIRLSFSTPQELKPYEIVYVRGRMNKKKKRIYVDSLRRIHE